MDGTFIVSFYIRTIINAVIIVILEFLSDASTSSSSLTA